MKKTNKFWFEVYTDGGKDIGTMTIAQAETIDEAIKEQKEFKKLFPEQIVLIDMWHCIGGLSKPMGQVSMN